MENGMTCNRLIAVCVSAFVSFNQATSGPHVDLFAQDAELEKESMQLQDHSARGVTLNQKADGYRGIWYMNQPSADEYVYKYSGGLGTYCAKHRPFAIYSREANKTFFCYGGAKADDNRALLHMVSYFDHETKTVPRPTILLDKKTDDAHDNPVISIDQNGYIWIFSTSHGRARPSYIHKSVRPYDIDEFQLVNASRLKEAVGKRIEINNFSYMQIWHRSGDGFSAFFTRYNDPAKRTICYMNSTDGKSWSNRQRIAVIDEGHYQVSGMGRTKIGSMFNYHPDGKGLNWRTNLYYVESLDNGVNWRSVAGDQLELPLLKADNPALIHNYQAEGLNVYLKDIQFDKADRPVLLYVTSRGYESGPKNDPRTWTIAKWTGANWEFDKITTSDNNYDFGELILNRTEEWVLIAPTETGPQPYNPGGEVARWLSRDQGKTWSKQKQLTFNSKFNHTYVRQVQNAHPDFVAIWADGHGRKPSTSSLYVSDSKGNVFRLPPDMGSSEVLPLEEFDQ